MFVATEVEKTVLRGFK